MKGNYIKYLLLPRRKCAMIVRLSGNLSFLLSVMRIYCLSVFRNSDRGLKYLCTLYHNRGYLSILKQKIIFSRKCLHHTGPALIIGKHNIEFKSTVLK